MKKIIYAIFLFIALCSSSLAQNICLYNPSTSPSVRIYDLNNLDVYMGATVSITQYQYNSSSYAQSYVRAGILVIVGCSLYTPTATSTVTPVNSFTLTVTPTITFTITSTPTPTPYWVEVVNGQPITVVVVDQTPEMVFIPTPVDTMIVNLPTQVSTLSVNAYLQGSINVNTIVPTISFTATNTFTSTITATPTSTFTSSNTPTITNSPTVTNTPTITWTPGFPVIVSNFPLSSFSTPITKNTLALLTESGLVGFDSNGNGQLIGVTSANGAYALNAILVPTNTPTITVTPVNSFTPTLTPTVTSTPFTNVSCNSGTATGFSSSSAVSQSILPTRVANYLVYSIQVWSNSGSTTVSFTYNGGTPVPGYTNIGIQSTGSSFGWPPSCGAVAGGFNNLSVTQNGTAALQGVVYAQ